MFNPKQNFLEEQLLTSGINLSITLKEIGRGIGDFFTDGAISENEYNREQAASQNKFNKKIHEFNKEEAKRTNDYQAESLRITKDNAKANRKFETESLKNAYKHTRAMQLFEDQQAKKEFRKSRDEAFDQISFNAIAQKQALKDQSRYLAEQLADLTLTQRESLNDYQFASAGVALKRKQARSQAAFETRKTSIAGLKAKGAAAARGQSGRSAAKVQQAIAAEVGANQAEIVQALLNTEAGIDLDLVKMSNQLNDDMAKIKLSQISLAAGDKSARKRIKMEREQADMNALASILLKPSALPPLPKPIALPKPEYQDPFKSKAPPKAANVIAPQRNLLAAGMSATADRVAQAVGIYNGLTQKNG